MSVNNILDGSFAVGPSGVINTVNLLYNSTTKNSIYTKNGSICTLLLPTISNFVTNYSTIQITVPDLLVPKQSTTFYGQYTTNNISFYPISVKLVAGSNTMTIMSQDTNTLVEGPFTVPQINITSTIFITYQTN